MRGVRMISWLAAGLVAYGFLFAYIAIHLAPATWWMGAAQTQETPFGAAPTSRGAEGLVHWGKRGVFLAT